MRTVHVVMGGGIVVGAYWRWDHAIAHARCITGCTVDGLDLDTIPAALRAIVEAEVRADLPPEIRRDIEIEEEWNEEDVTPQVVEVDDLEDVGPR